ncbi:MAG: hypothetical protein JXL84_26635 [Deltaproteobacteria bacterium]|nr:hypothetical protein [Deltaproteobacteria bacterium]
MKLKCMYCGSELNLDHHVFNDYEGSVKCFCCSAMMEIRTRKGWLDSVQPMPLAANGLGEHLRAAAPA